MCVPLYILCIALVTTAYARNAQENVLGFYTDPEDTVDSYNYLLPRLVTKYRPSTPWNGITNSEYLLDTMKLGNEEPEERFKRAGNGPSLSIINPLDVLRQRLLLEMARRQMRESAKQVAENRKLMKTIGKRGGFLRQPNSNVIEYGTM